MEWKAWNDWGSYTGDNNSNNNANNTSGSFAISEQGMWWERGREMTHSATPTAVTQTTSIATTATTSTATPITSASTSGGMIEGLFSMDRRAVGGSLFCCLSFF